MAIVDELIRKVDNLEIRIDAVEHPEFAVMQTGGAAPAGNAAESVLWFDTVNDDLYVNADGANTWQLIAGGGGAVAPHNLLSASHSDTSADVPNQGSVIVGNATPAWDELVIGGANFLFQVNAGGTDPAWQTFDWDNMAAGAGADMVHSHANAGEGGTIAVAAISDLAYAAPNLTLGVANAAGAANTVIRTDATILVFDAVVPNVIQPDDAAATGAATVAARRDHEHGIVAAAPGANSVNVAASAEGVGTSFSRNDHTHNLDESIVPTWTGIHTHQANVVLDDGVGDSPLLSFIGGSNDDTVSLWLDDDGAANQSDLVMTLAGSVTQARFIVETLAANPAFAVTGARDILGYGDLYLANQIISLNDQDTIIDIGNGDQIVFSAGGVEFLRFTEVAQDETRFNDAGADIDFIVEASGVADALVVQGNDGQITLGALGAGFVLSTAGGVLDSSYVVNQVVTNSLIYIDAGTAGVPGANIELWGSTHPANPDTLALDARLLLIRNKLATIEYIRAEDAAQDIVIINEDGVDIDFRVEGTGVPNALFVNGANGLVGVGIGSPTTGQLVVDQAEAAGSLPALHLLQLDVSEEFIRFQGTAAAGVLTQSIVDYGDEASSTGAVWLKVYVVDDGNQVTDQAYHILGYALSA
jgi:hypothetical protein